VWGSGGIAPPFLTSALDGGEWSASRPGRYIPGKKPLVSIEYEAGWAPVLVLTLWSREKSIAPAVNRTPVFQPEVRRYTDWAIPAPTIIPIEGLISLLYNLF
jgi:hypothetical protein